MEELFNAIKALFASLVAKVKSWFTKEPDTPNEADDPDIPDIERPDRPGEVVCYYGCPNSDKAQKLQLKKELYK